MSLPGCDSEMSFRALGRHDLAHAVHRVHVLGHGSRRWWSRRSAARNRCRTPRSRSRRSPPTARTISAIRRVAGRRLRPERHDPEAALLELEHEHQHPRRRHRRDLAAGDPKVGVYIDGVFMSKTVGGVFDVADLERIEVLRGPQGTLFGRNTTGGAVNVTTKKPTGEARARRSRLGGQLRLRALRRQPRPAGSGQRGRQALVQPHGDRRLGRQPLRRPPAAAGHGRRGRPGLRGQRGLPHRAALDAHRGA
jgi:hypothetical protein